MRAVPPVSRFLAWCLVLSLCTSAGCGGCGRAVKEDDKGKPTTKTEDPVQVARDLLRNASSVQDYRQALDLLSPQLPTNDEMLKRDSLGSAEQWRRLLVERYGLEDDELKEVEAAKFTPLDAHHLSICIHLNEAVSSLPIRGQPPLEQARSCFEWVTRQVLLQENGMDLLPPALSLMRGHGTAHDRALVFLAMLHQLDLDDCMGCMVALPAQGGAGVRYWLPGILVGKKEKADVYLFDTRLGIPLPGPGGKGIATLTQLQKQPELLKALSVDDKYRYDVSPDELKVAELHLVCSLSALTPRMRYLEDTIFTGQNRVKVSVHPADALKRLEEAARDAKLGRVGVWNARAAGKAGRPRTPLRMLRMALPSSEGGGGPNDGTDLFSWTRQQVFPWVRVRKALLELDLLDIQGKVTWQETLFNRVEHLFTRYIQTPRDQLARGRVEESSKRLVQIRTLVDEFGETQARERNFPAQVADWKKERREAYAMWKSGAAGAKARLDALWNDDQFLLQLLLSQEDDDTNLIGIRPDKDNTKPRPEKRLLSKIVFAVVGETLHDHAVYLQALHWHEKAERASTRHEQLSAEKGKGAKAVKTAEEKAADMWRNAEDHWKEFGALYRFTAKEFKSRLDTAVVYLVQIGQPQLAVEWWDNVAREHRIAVSARMFYVDALLALSASNPKKLDQAKQVLTELSSYLASLEQHKELRAFQEAVIGDLTPQGRAMLEKLWFGDFAPRSTVYWQRYAVLLKLRHLSAKQ